MSNLVKNKKHLSHIWDYIIWGLAILMLFAVCHLYGVKDDQGGFVSMNIMDNLIWREDFNVNRRCKTRLKFWAKAKENNLNKRDKRETASIEYRNIE